MEKQKSKVQILYDISIEVDSSKYKNKKEFIKKIKNAISYIQKYSKKGSGAYSKNVYYEIINEWNKIKKRIENGK